LQKVALITGTGSGIGKALAELLLSAKYIVFGYSRTNQIKHNNFTFTPIDLSNLKEVQKIKFPKVEVATEVLLVNNAATIGSILPLDKKATTDIINEYNLNLITPTLLSKLFINIYSKNQKLLINIRSGAATSPIASWSSYCAAKSGLDMLTEVIEKEKHKNLKVFSLHPGVVDTNMQQKIRESDAKYFSLLDKFTAYYNNGELNSTDNVAQKIYRIIAKKVVLADILVKLIDFE